MEKMHCKTCTCHEVLLHFTNLALIPTPGSRVTPIQAWLRYIEWTKANPQIETPGFTPNQFTRALRQLGLRIELAGGRGNQLIGYTLIPPILSD